MGRIPFTKAHGAKNDFLLTWANQLAGIDLNAAALAICDRHTGVGADGWILVAKPGPESADVAIRLFNADGGEVELSGNGTRCAAAFAIAAGHAAPVIRIHTAAGLKFLQLRERSGNRFEFAMNMGKADCRHLHCSLPLSSGERDVTILNVGNPQCAVFVDNFAFDWRSVGAEIERHPRFPQRTNVSFVRVVDGNTIDVRFFERGVGETMSSGTGSTGAAAAAVMRGVVEPPVTVRTPAGPLDLSWANDEIWLVGPAEIIAEGQFWLRP